MAPFPWFTALTTLIGFAIVLTCVMATSASKPTPTINYLRNLITSSHHRSRTTTTALLLCLLISSRFSPRTRYYLRMIAFLLGLAVGSMTGVLAGIGVSFIRPSWRKNIQWLVARTFYGLVGPLIGWEFVVEGEDHLQACYRGESHVLVGNHQSMVRTLSSSSSSSSLISNSFFVEKRQQKKRMRIMSFVLMGCSSFLEKQTQI